ncbi:YceI family protein [Autumnicola musiva]|uniref:YceI family protein n=1 Tax=Autumnicola musiva TaxID=3075589 RepID=A0ABU3DA81_9FLAO|nr:YceI family protein [Zunongwangia sp. F117]MDT0678449.1 YceI family protein [Zunongwangia sp. F117]
MKRQFLFLVFIFATSASFSQQVFEQQNIRILPESSLNITGDTNISKFNCEFNASLLEGKKTVQLSKSGKNIHFKDAVLVLKNEGFYCGNRAIKKDFHALMQTEKYPSIKLELKKAIMKDNGDALAQVVIHMAGKTKTYEVPVEIISCPTPNFKGLLELNINDFGLEPPRKLFGLIVIKEEIEINFNLVIKPI